MKGLNKVQIIGNLGKDPEIKYMPSGAAVAKFSVATAEKWKDKQTGEMQERTEWHNVVAFNKIAEVIGKYLAKGSKVYVEGQLKTDKWQDNNGNDRWTTSIVVRDMLMLDGPQGAQNAPGATQQAPQQSAPQQQAPRQQQAAAPQQQQIPDDFDEDIPF